MSRFVIDLDALVRAVGAPDAPTEAELRGCGESLVDNALALCRQDPVIAFGVMVRALISFAAQTDIPAGILMVAINDLERELGIVGKEMRGASDIATGPYRKPPSDDTLDMPTEDD